MNQGTILGGARFSLTSQSAVYPMTLEDHTVLADTTAAGFTVTLPDPVLNPRMVVAVKKTAAANTLTIASAGAGTIDGAATVSLFSLNSGFIAQSDGTNWKILADISSQGSTPEWVKITVTHTQLQAAALTNNILLFTLPIAGVIHAVKVKHSTAFAGPAITGYKVSIGLAGDLQRYTMLFDVLAAVTGTNFLLSNVLASESHTATTALQIAAVSVGANLSVSNAGVVDIWLLISTAS